MNFESNRFMVWFLVKLVPVHNLLRYFSVVNRNTLNVIYTFRTNLQAKIEHNILEAN